jgi:hypothetical protein
MDLKVSYMPTESAEKQRATVTTPELSGRWECSLCRHFNESDWKYCRGSATVGLGACDASRDMFAKEQENANPNRTDGECSLLKSYYEKF